MSAKGIVLISQIPPLPPRPPPSSLGLVETFRIMKKPLFQSV